MNPTRAFSLIELLIVVAIISILTTIALPNFLESQTRSKVARALSDMRTLAGAYKAYFADRNGYPSNPEDLTAPVAYISSVPYDLFSRDRDWYRFDPKASGTPRLWSVGPNRIDDGGTTLYDPSNGSVSGGDVIFPW